MPRTITAKGIGKVSAAPDFVVLSMGLESQDMDYEKAMNIASENIDNLNAALEQVGFEKNQLRQQTLMYIRITNIEDGKTEVTKEYSMAMS